MAADRSAARSPGGMAEWGYIILHKKQDISDGEM